MHGLEVAQAERWPGWGGRQELSGSVCGALHQRGGGAAEESRCSPALTLFTASVTGPVSYRGQPVFGMRASVRVREWRKSEVHA